MVIPKLDIPSRHGSVRYDGYFVIPNYTKAQFAVIHTSHQTPFRRVATQHFNVDLGQKNHPVNTDNTNSTKQFNIKAPTALKTPFSTVLPGFGEKIVWEKQLKSRLHAAKFKRILNLKTDSALTDRIGIPFALSAANSSIYTVDEGRYWRWRCWLARRRPFPHSQICKQLVQAITVQKASVIVVVFGEVVA